jgi:predicted enzyme related to lactoylglutathione lyase
MTDLAAATPVSFVLTADRISAKAFYQTALGLALMAEDGFAVTFALGGGATMRLTDLPDHKPLTHTVLGWNVADIHASVADLKARGVGFRIYDGFGQDEDGIWASPGGDAKVAWFTDPDGNVLSLTQFG